jgi:hypothetical protein
MRGLVSSFVFLLVLMAPVLAQDSPAPELPQAEGGVRTTDSPKDEKETEAKPEAQAPDIIETTDRASEDLPLIFPADI